MPYQNPDKQNKVSEPLKPTQMTALAALLSIFGSITAQAETLTIEMLIKLSQRSQYPYQKVTMSISKGPDSVRLPKKSKTSKKTQ